MSSINGFPYQQGSESNDIFGSLSPFQNLIFNQSSSQLNAAPNLGETIRGMTNVSPLVTQKHTGLDIDEIKNRYFIDGTSKSSKNTAVVCDVDSHFDGIEKQSGDFKYSDGVYAYTVYLFYSKDAIKLAEAFECLMVKEKQVVFFIEDNTGDFSERYAAVKIDPSLAKTLKHSINTDLMDNKYLYDVLKGVLPDLSDNEINELLYHGKLEYKGTAIVAKILSFINLFNKSLFPLSLLSVGKEAFFAGSEAIGKLAELIEKAKVDDYRWDPTADKLNEDGSVDEAYNKNDFQLFLFPGIEEDINSTDFNTKTQENIKNAVNNLLATIESQDQTIKNLLGINSAFNINSPQSISEMAYSKYLQVTQTVKSKMSELQQLDFAGIAKLGLRMVNAFLCGLWNSLVDAVSSLVLLVKYIFDTLATIQDFLDNVTTELPKLTEHLDNLLQAFSEIDFSRIMITIAKKLVGLVSQVSISSTALIKTAYFTGAFYGYVVSLMVEIAIGILISGGVISVEAIVARLVTTFKDMFALVPRLTKNLVKKTAEIAVNGIKYLYKMLTELTGFLRKGTDEFLEIIDDLFKYISGAFYDLKKIDLDSSETDELFRKIAEGFKINRDEILTIADLKKFRIFLKKSFGISLEIVDKTPALKARLRHWNSLRVAASFNPTSKILYVRKQISAYTAQHELYHVKLWYKLNIEHPEMAELYKNTLGDKVFHEEYVMSEFMKSTAKWNEVDLLNDLDNINAFRQLKGLDKVGLENYKNWDLTEELKKI